MKAEILSKTIDDMIFYNPDSPNAKLEAEVNRIDTDYFEDIRRDAEIIPPELCPQLRERILDDFRHKIARILSEDSCNHIISKWVGLEKDPIPAETASSLAFLLREKAKSLQCSNGDLSPFEEEINRLYRAAQTRTFGERILGTNKNDVISFHHVLMQNTVCHVRQLINAELEKFIYKLAEKFENIPV